MQDMVDLAMRKMLHVWNNVHAKIYNLLFAYTAKSVSEWVYQTHIAIKGKFFTMLMLDMWLWIAITLVTLHILCCFFMGMSATWKSTACRNLPVLYRYIWPTRSKLGLATAYSGTRHVYSYRCDDDLAPTKQANPLTGYRVLTACRAWR